MPAFFEIFFEELVLFLKAGRKDRPIPLAFKIIIKLLSKKMKIKSQISFQYSRDKGFGRIKKDEFYLAYWAY